MLLNAIVAYKTKLPMQEVLEPGRLLPDGCSAFVAGDLRSIEGDIFDAC